MRRSFFIIGTFILAVSFCFAQQQGYRKSWALIVGINEYQSLPMLSGAVRSAKLVREKLVREFGFELENVFELYDDQATRENILKAFDKLMDPKRVGRDDRVFIYFAGHGVTRLVAGKDKGYIMPVDGVMERFASTAISTDQLHEFQEAIPAKHVFFAMDACYSGTIFTRGIGLREETFASKSEAIIRFTGKKARIAITAGSKDEQVMDLADQGISIFAFYFLKGLDGEADINGDGLVTSSELADFIAKNVRFRAPQNPQYGKLPGDEGGEFVFIRATEIVTEQKQLIQQQEVTQPKIVGKEEKISKANLLRYWLFVFAGAGINDYSKRSAMHIETSIGAIGFKTVKIPDGNFENKGSISTLVGFGFEYQVHPKLALTLNVFHENKVGNFKVRPFSNYFDPYSVEFGPDVDVELKVGYLTINPMMKTKFGSFYFNAGLALGFPTDRQKKFVAGYVVKRIETVIGSGTIYRIDEIREAQTRFSFPFGVGYEFRVGNFKIFIEAKSDKGLTKISKEENWTISSTQLMIGGRYGF